MPGPPSSGNPVLLSAALMLATILPAGYFANHWLTVKLALVVVYIVLGAFALRRTRTRATRSLCFAGAAAVLALVMGIAVIHHPLGWLVWLRAIEPVRETTACDLDLDQGIRQCRCLI